MSQFFWDKRFQVVWLELKFLSQARFRAVLRTKESRVVNKLTVVKSSFVLDVLLLDDGKVRSAAQKLLSIANKGEVQD